MEPVVSTDNKKSMNPLQQLDAIDLMLLRRHYRDAAHAYFQLLDSLGSEWALTSFSRPDHHGDENYAMYEICERATRQWLQILSSDADLAKLNYTLFIANIGMMHAILMGTSQGTLDDFISALHRKTGGNYQVPDFLRIVLAWCPNSRIGFDIFAYYTQAPELIMAHALGCVSGIGLISEESNRHRNKAIDFLIANRDSNIDKLGAICLSSAVLNAWMRCSYAEHPDKHKVKHLLNRMIQRGAQLSDKKSAVGKVPPILRERPANRPLMVVPLETFSGKHAMYRCYANILLACREHFYMVGLAGTNYWDDDTVALFDEFFDADEISGSDPRMMENIILSWKPDVVYYPSVGMAVWVIALANTRLAPVQVMSIGHPATSMSRTMDYVIVDEGRVSDASVFSEKVLAMPRGSNRFVLPSGSQRVEPIMVPPADGIIRVAVPSISQKLTGSFIRALRRAQQAVPGKLQYVFFIGTRSVYYAATVQSLSRQLKHIECHGELGYNDYISELNRCHLHAGTFPFGGTNSLIDSMRQGLPVLALEGDEPHARVDGDFVRRAGLPEKLVCYSEDEYVERLVELVSDPEQLMALRRYLVNEVDIDRIFLQEGRPECYAEALAALVSEKAG